MYEIMTNFSLEQTGKLICNNSKMSFMCQQQQQEKKKKKEREKKFWLIVAAVNSHLSDAILFT